jgi:hypothetical protein
MSASLAKASIWYGLPMTSPDHARPLASAVLRDGTLLEMLQREREHATLYARHHEGHIEELDFAELDGNRRVIPYSPSNNLLTHRVVLFPSTASEYESEEELVHDVRQFIHRYADLSESFEEAAIYYVLLTWVYDTFNELPYLRLKGDFGTGKTRCLLTIGSLCYKPMFVSGASTVSPMFRIIDSFRGTLILDESDFRFSDEKAEIVKILNNGNARGFPVLRSEATPTKEFNPRAFDVFGPKIIASRSLFEDPALESRCITETMTGLPARKDIPISLPASFHDEALEVRNKLLTYRFRTFGRIRAAQAAVDQRLEPRIAQVFTPLLAVTSDTDAQNRILLLAKRHAESLAADREGSIQAQILDIMWAMRTEGAPWSVKDIAERFATRYGNDLERPVTPRWIGFQLRRRLGVSPVRRGGAFFVPESSDAQVAILFRRYGVGDVSGDVGISDVAAKPDLG